MYTESYQNEKEEDSNVCIVPLFSDALPNGTYTFDDLTIENIKIHTRKTKNYDGLFVDDVWPGAVVISNYLVKNPILVKDKSILEFGAGAALPSLVCLRLNPSLVVITDYPESSVINNIHSLIYENGFNEGNSTNVFVQSHIWGDDVSNLLSYELLDGKKFNLIILAELLWQDTYKYHKNLLFSTANCLYRENGIVLVSFVHRPTEIHAPLNDLEFFTRAESDYGFEISLIGVFEMNLAFI